MFLRAGRHHIIHSAGITFPRHTCHHLGFMPAAPALWELPAAHESWSTPRSFWPNAECMNVRRSGKTWTLAIARMVQMDLTAGGGLHTENLILAGHACVTTETFVYCLGPRPDKWSTVIDVQDHASHCGWGDREKHDGPILLPHIGRYISQSPASPACLR